MKLVSVAQMKAIEDEAVSSGTSVAMLMEKAGAGIADYIRENFAEGSLVVTGLIGSGNNGGDTLVALAALAQEGWQAQALLVRPREMDDPLVERLIKYGGMVQSAEPKKRGQWKKWLEESALLLDGVLGAGIRLPLKAEVAEVLSQIREMDLCMPVIAVDCPSGVDMETGEAARETIPADITLCMGAVKEGLLRFPAFELAGFLEVIELGFSPKLPVWKAAHSEVVTAQMVTDLLPPREMNSHKGTFGTAVIVAGSTNYTGAALLAGRAAYRTGAGLVRLAVPGPVYGALAGHLAEATWLILPHEQGVIHADAAAVLRENLEKVSAMLLGPGWGREETTAEFLKNFLQSGSGPARKGRIGFLEEDRESRKAKAQLPPLVIDADGLNLLARMNGWQKDLPAETILTPHPGEMATLTGLTVEEIQADRKVLVEKFSREWGQVVVLKGAITLIAAPDGRVFAIPVATSALAKAGSGDILAGMIAGLRAQGVSAVGAAVCGAWIHAQAGLAAVEFSGDEASVMAGDVLEAIGEVLAELR